MPILVDVAQHFADYRRVYMTAFYRINERARDEGAGRQPSGRIFSESFPRRCRGGRRPGYLRIKTHQLRKRTLGRRFWQKRSWVFACVTWPDVVAGTSRLSDKSTSFGA